jgi:serine/threonine protein phosphatase PrpC
MKEPFHPPYVTAKPDVFMHKLDPADAFLVIATDGLWDRVTNDDAVEMVSQCLQTSSTENIATSLIKKGND